MTERYDIEKIIAETRVRFADALALSPSANATDEEGRWRHRIKATLIPLRLEGVRAMLALANEGASRKVALAAIANVTAGQIVDLAFMHGSDVSDDFGTFVGEAAEAVAKVAAGVLSEADARRSPSSPAPGARGHA